MSIIKQLLKSDMAMLMLCLFLSVGGTFLLFSPGGTIGFLFFILFLITWILIGKIPDVASKHFNELIETNEAFRDDIMLKIIHTNCKKQRGESCCQRQRLEK